MNKIINKKNILYIIVGIFTSLLNILLFMFFNMFNINYLISNLFTLIIVKIISYIGNKLIVFKSKCNNKKELTKEFILFMYYRLLTLILDFVLLYLMVDIININKTISKIIVTIIVVVVNYVFSEKYVFNKKQKMIEFK